MIFDAIPENWKEVLRPRVKCEEMHRLSTFLEKEKGDGKIIYPKEELIFNALVLCPYPEVKVVIVGQDPYHGHGQAHGLAFSVPSGEAIPPSLRNIFKEMESDLGIEKRDRDGCLDYLAKQGVLLLNATLTVREKDPLSHSGMGWENFTDAVVEAVAAKQEPVVFVLWGKYAIQKCERISIGPQHLVLTAPHPSPFSASRGFFGCKHFSKINNFLKTPIQWALDSPLPNRSEQEALLLR